ncbi:MAG: fumarylacetoacetate hydrolase family protein [Candidatus Thermoplasmatota archaeon]
MIVIPVRGRKGVRPSKVICLLRNYVEHAEEMSSAPAEEPYFFLKPPSALVLDEGNIRIPKGIGEVHHEVELAVVMGRGGKSISQQDALSHVLGYALLIDVTARDVQAKAKKAGLPWTIAKGYDTFAPVSEIVPRGEVPDPHNLEIWLKVNGMYRQRSTTALMNHKVPRIIEYVSGIMSLEPGDIIATGTPKGVGPLAAGDVVEAGVEGVGRLRIKVVEA